MAAQKKRSARHRTIGVKLIPPSELIPNPHNPRRLFDREPLDTLKESIRKVGILVPLTVYYDPKKKRYVILDGQRRWICAQELELDEVPANEVAEPTLVENITTMFQIHKLREDWELMPTALKLELLMEELDERADGTIAELTGLDQAVVQRCKKLLDFPRKYQDMMLYEDPDSRVKADFFIELYAVRNDRFVNSLKWFDRDKFTDAMLKRYLHGKLKAVTDFRIMKQHIANAKKAGKEGEVGRRLKAFTEDENLTLDSLQVDATAILEAAALQKRADKFRSELAEIDVDGCLGEEDFWTSLESLLETIRETLRAAGRRPKR